MLARVLPVLVAMLLKTRRVVYVHTAGPYPGLRQILGLISDDGVQFLHTGEFRPFTPQSGTGDVLAAVQMCPDGRWSKGMRLRSTDRYALFQEKCVQPAVVATPEEPAA